MNLPSDWDSYKIHYRYRETTYRVTVIRQTKDTGKTLIKTDGVQQDGFIKLTDDHKEHIVEVFFGSTETEGRHIPVEL